MVISIATASWLLVNVQRVLAAPNFQKWNLCSWKSKCTMTGGSGVGSGPSPVRIADIAELTGAKCRIKNLSAVERKLNELIVGGPRRLQIISDFDHTITKQGQVNGRNVESSFGILNACKSLPANYIEQSHALYLKYRPLEINPNLPHDVRVKYMVEWWSQTSDQLTGFEFRLEEIDKVAEQYRDCIRDGTAELLAELNRLAVPVLVFSAGLGDSVISLMRQADIYFPNVKVVSNFLQFGENNLLNGLQKQMIHTFNKNEHALEGSEYYDCVKDRDHVIVMGDSLGDATMADGVPAQSHVLKIGFLYDHVDEYLDQYMDTFDIVLIDDQTMDVPRKLLALIVNNSSCNIAGDSSTVE